MLSQEALRVDSSLSSAHPAHASASTMHLMLKNGASTKREKEGTQSPGDVCSVGSGSCSKTSPCVCPSAARLCSCRVERQPE